MSLSAITAAEAAFTVLACEPSPMCFDARGIAGLPEHPLDLLDLRARLGARTPGGKVLPDDSVDEVWRRLAGAAREWGPAWVVAAVGIAAPGLTRMAARLSTGRAHLGEDIDSEIVTGFLQALRTEDLAAPRVWVRMAWAAWRCAERAAQLRDEVEIPLDLPTGSRMPRAPYGHPDLILARAASLGVISREGAALIGETRIGDVLIDQIAAARGVSAPVLRMRRLRAEQDLLAALARGDLYGTGIAATCDEQARARADGLTPAGRSAA
jgi:hypothetical protein